MEIRNPKKGEGVPRETVSNNCIGELTKALQATSLGLMNKKSWTVRFRKVILMHR
jgi:hypothetical protein